MTEVDSINPAGDTRVSHHYASLNNKAYREKSFTVKVMSCESSK